MESLEFVGVGRGRCADGRTLSIGWFVPRCGNGSISSRTTSPSCATPTSAVDRVPSPDDPTGCGSNTVLLESLESRLYECLLWGCVEEGVAKDWSGGEADEVDCCKFAERGLLGTPSDDAVALESTTGVISLETVSLERELAPVPFLFCLAFFLAAAALSLLRSRVPNPSELHRACSRVSSCSALR